MKKIFVLLALISIQAQAFTSTELLIVANGTVECRGEGRQDLTIYNDSTTLKGGLITQTSASGAHALSLALSRLEVSQFALIGRTGVQEPYEIHTETAFSLVGAVNSTYLNFDHVKFNCTKLEIKTRGRE